MLVSSQKKARCHAPALRKGAEDETIRGLIARSACTFSARKIGVFGARMREREDLLGFCGFICLEGMGEPDLRYELSQPAWGRGIVTEVAWACARYTAPKPTRRVAPCWRVGASRPALERSVRRR
jgi:hypothetical protein